jgi:acyl-CoA synthetase (AMP-forming)/AMP-acid ligase II
LQIWNENNQPVPPGESGEIVARTEGQMQGFRNNSQATAERIVDGWVKTGDIGRLDENGYLYMLDRADDMVISGGFNIYPAELENVIAARGRRGRGVRHPRSEMGRVGRGRPLPSRARWCA